LRKADITERARYEAALLRGFFLAPEILSMRVFNTNA
jgi:hypothetical protein